MAVPVECAEIEDFTPPVLANIAVPPVFRLRPASGREWRNYQYALRAEGLEYHGAETFRSETLRALKDLWSPEDYEANAVRLRSYWELLDQKGTPDPAEAASIDDLTTRLAKAWRPLAVMAADNMRFVDESMKIAAAMFIVGWSNVDLGYVRDAGRVPLGRLDELETWLEGVEKKAAADKVEGVADPGTAFVQLCNAAYARLHLTEDEEKNSSSPPPSPPSPNGSTRKSSRRTVGAGSKASASSKSTTAS